MTTRRGNQASAANSNKAKSGQAQQQKHPYVTRYAAVDSHLSERSGSTDFVFGLAGERPAGRKLAKDIADICNQLHSEGYEVISIVPVTSGRVTEATVEAAEEVEGRTYNRFEDEDDDEFEEDESEEKPYVDTGVGYSVTDGVVITAKRRN